MKISQKLILLLALTLAFTSRAATNDVAEFSGTVVDSQGNQVAGATVDCYQYPTQRSLGPVDLEPKQHTTTDSQGAFAFPAFNGIGIVLVTKNGSAPTWRMWYAAPAESQKIALPASSVLAGVVADDAGRPVADAEVWVASALNKTMTENGQPNFLFGKIARQYFSTRTAADGKFRIENFPADAQAGLSVEKTGLVLHQTATSPQYDQLPFHAGQEDIALTLDPAGSVTGSIAVRGTGQPLASAMLVLQPAVPGMASFLSSQKTAVSAADGSFQISDVPPGSYQVMADFTNKPVADWVADSVPVTVAVGATASGVQLQAYKGGVLEVTVRGKGSQEPVPDANVFINNEENSNRGGSTGTNGVAYFRLPSGSFTVFVNKQDMSQAQAQATVAEGQTAQVTIELNEPFKVAGIVRDASGAPVAGANVGVFPDYGGYGGISTVAKTDAGGHYDLSWQKPAWAGQQNQSFYLLARQVERKLAVIQEIDETTTNLDVTLKPAMSVSSSVQDPSGKAVTNVMAYVMLNQGNSSFEVSRQPVHSDEQGRIRMEALPLGERYNWFVNAQGYGSAQAQMDAADPKADHYDFPPIVLKLANLKLAGRVLGTDGKPVAGANIWMNGEGQPNGNTTTDADGRFAYDAVCEGALSLNANLKGAGGQADANGGDTNVVIRLAAQNYYAPQNPLTLTGTVSGPSGHPAIGARVIVTPSWGQTDVAQTDAGGKYSVGWQPQMGMRNAKYFAIARDLDQDLAAIEPVDTNKTSVDLRLGPGLSISGTVEDAQGAPLPRANVNLDMMAGNMGGMVDNQGVKVNSDGTYTIPALPMGQNYIVFVSVNGYGSASKNISKKQSQTNSIQLTPFKLKIADRVLSGQVLGADNQPLSGAQVNINGNGQPNGNMRSDATGHFKFKVCDGPIQVYAYSPSGGGQNSYGTAQAHGGDSNVIVKMGVRQQQRQFAGRDTPLEPQPWTLSALMAWPPRHKTGAIILLSVQGAALLGTAGGVFWVSRRRGRRGS